MLESLKAYMPPIHLDFRQSMTGYVGLMYNIQIIYLQSVYLAKKNLALDMEKDKHSLQWNFIFSK